MHKIFLLAILLVLNCFESFGVSAAAAVEEPQPTPLFRAQKTSSAQDPQVYVLGSVHTKPWETYP